MKPNQTSGPKRTANPTISNTRVVGSAAKRVSGTKPLIGEHSGAKSTASGVASLKSKAAAPVVPVAPVAPSPPVVEIQWKGTPVECYSCKNISAYCYNRFSKNGGTKYCYRCKECAATFSNLVVSEEDYDFLSN
jgi:hypothetical protein